MTKPKATPAEETPTFDLAAITEELKDANLHTRIAWVQHHIGHVEKTAKVKFGNVEFMAMQEHGLINVARALWRAAGLSVIGGCIDPKGFHVIEGQPVPEGRKREDYYFVDWALTVSSTKDGESITRYYPNVGKDNADKGLNKAMTAANKYAIQKFFQIPTQQIDDNDTVELQSQLPGTGVAAQLQAETTTKPTDQDVAALREMLKEAANEGLVSTEWIKNTLTATYGVSKIADLDKKQFAEFAVTVAGRFSKPTG